MAERVAVLEAEDEIRDLLTAYTYYHDANDVDRLVSVLHPDCELKAMQGTFKGKETIRKFFKGHVGKNTPHAIWDTKHHITNETIRVMPGCKEAWATAFFLVTLTTKEADKEVGAIGGGLFTYNLVKKNGRWLVYRWKIYRQYDTALSGVPNLGSVRLGYAGTHTVRRSVKRKERD